MYHYQEGDKVFIFGFSRGAFTARALAGMLHKCGLLGAACENLLPYLSEIYHEKDNEKLAMGFKQTFSRSCKPHFIGVWDTVKSLGYLTRKGLHNNILNPDIKHAYHAISIDERRRHFYPLLWDESAKPPKQVIEQMWFSGMHSDVGGGYPDKGLSDITLQWILMNAEKEGLRLRDNWQDYMKPNSCASLHDENNRLWKSIGIFRFDVPDLRNIPENAKIHSSVFERCNSKKHSYSPVNLPIKK